MVAIGGCGGGSFELDTAPVSGRVTLDGQPLKEGLVQIVPSKGRMARGLIQPDGTFELSTYDDGDGAQIGTFSATVTELLKDRASKEEIAAKYPIRIPKRYNRPATSGLTVEVKAGESNQVELALTTNPE